MSIQLNIGANPQAAIDGIQKTVDGLQKLSSGLQSTSNEVKKADLTWTQFVGQRMGSYMQQFGSHGAAIKKISEEWKAYKEGLETVIPTANKTADALDNLQSKIEGEGTVKQITIPPVTVPPIVVPPIELPPINTVNVQKSITDVQSKIQTLGASVKSVTLPQITPIPASVPASYTSVKQALDDLGKKGVLSIASIEGSMQQLRTIIKSTTDPADLKKLKDAYAELQSRLNSFKNESGLAQQLGGVTRATRLAHGDLEIMGQSLRGLATGSERGVDALSNLVFTFERLGGVSGGLKGALKEIGAVLLSPAGIILGVTTLAAILPEVIEHFDEFGKIAREVNKAFVDIAGKGAEAGAELKTLVSVVQDSNISIKEQKAATDGIVLAVDEWNKKTGDHIKVERDANGVLTKESIPAVNGLTEAMVKQARALGFLDAIKEGYKKVAQQMAKTLDSQTTFIGDFLTAANKDLLGGLFGKEDVVDRQKRLQAKSIKSAEDYVNRLIDAFKSGLVDNTLSLEGVFDTSKLTKNADDARRKIIESAKKIQSAFPSLVPGDFKILDVEDIDTQLKKANSIINDFKKGIGTFGKVQELRIQVIPEIAKLDISKQIEIPEIILPSAKIKILSPEFNIEGSAKRLGDILKDIRLPEQVAKDVKKLTDEFNKASTFAEKLQKAIDLGEVEKQLKVAQGSLGGINKEVAASALLLSDTLTPAFQNLFDAILKGEDPLKAFFDSIKNSIEQVIAKLIEAAIEAAILSAILPGGGGGFGKIFAGLLGARAEGGPVERGKPYVVGERGPEFFVPTVSGKIIPNHQINQFAKSSIENNEGNKSFVSSVVHGDNISTTQRINYLSEVVNNQNRVISSLINKVQSNNILSNAVNKSNIIVNNNSQKSFSLNDIAPAGNAASPIVIDLTKQLKTNYIINTLYKENNFFKNIFSEKSFSSLIENTKKFFTTLPTIPRFAEGGIVTGQTLGLLGEGGKTEVIMPLDKLKNLIGGKASQNDIKLSGQFRIDGKDLLLAIARNTNSQLRTT